MESEGCRNGAAARHPGDAGGGSWTPVAFRSGTSLIQSSLTKGVRQDVAGPAPCHTCIFYARPKLGARVLPRVESVVRNHRGVRDLRMYLWGFAAVESAPFSDRAQIWAEKADVVVLVSDDERGIPGPLRGWLERWLASVPGARVPLLALFHPRPPDRAPAVRLFRDLTEIAIHSSVGLIWRSLPEERPVSAVSLATS